MRKMQLRQGAGEQIDGSFQSVSHRPSAASPRCDQFATALVHGLNVSTLRIA
jgi:hypothetical protein